jgi:glutathione-regulated potassium-efflux system ancillary protein KefC
MALQSLLQLRIPVSEAATAIAKFREHDLALMTRQHAIYQDESKLIQTTREASEELLTLFEADREDVEVDGDQKK